MANEFVAKNGLISQNNTTVTGSLIHGLAGNIATGEYSHAEGSITKAIGNYSHAEGDFTEASGDYSHAEGQETIASGSYSHAEGYQTIAAANHQHVQGQWNVTSSIPAAFIVGNGTDDSNRSNLVFAAGSTFQVTGSLNVSSGITGSLQGTATTASYVLQAVSASFATTASIASSVVGATPTEIGYLSGVTSNIQTQLDNAADISIEAYQKLGSKVKAQTLGFNISNLTLNNVQIQGATGGSQIRLIPIYIQTPQTLTGVMWFQNTLGVYTPNNENRIGLYTYSGGTATLVASSSNDGNMWSGSYTTTATYTSKSFSTPYSANPDFYYIAMLMSFSAASTAPTFFAGANLVSTAVAGRSLDFTNGAILTAARTTVGALPGSITVSTYNTLIQGNIWAAVYS